MSRVRMVTRTLHNYTVSVLAVNTETQEVSTEKLHFFGEMPANMDKALRDKSTETMKYVSVVKVEDATEYRGMTEEDFYKYSVQVEPNTNKVVE